MSKTNRRTLLKSSAAVGFASAIASLGVGEVFGSESTTEAKRNSDDEEPAGRPNPLVPPAQGSIPAAFVISEGAVVIDFCGPWEVFNDVNLPGS
jgi:hypothetical protein